MRYRVTCLTPTLVGDGQKLAPIDYMVWRDQVNVLDQRRIFNLLSKGPRLDSYLSQLKRAEKLDFASWGGFAQNFAGRRIPFEHPSIAKHWEQTRAEFLFVPTFASSLTGPFLPGAAVKGALRTAAIAARWSHQTIEQMRSRMDAERVWRKVSMQAEAEAVGGAGADRMRVVRVADSDAVGAGQMKVYMLRVATLVARGPKQELGWKTSPRGASEGRKPEGGTPTFAEMAPPGTAFEGDWFEDKFLKEPEIARALHWRQPERAHLLESANKFADALLASHVQYCQATGLDRVGSTVQDLRKRLEETRGSGRACLLPLGWGGGYQSKTSYSDTKDEALRSLLGETPFYGRAIQTGLPFPKTRRVIFLEDQPASIPGWTLLELT